MGRPRRYDHDEAVARWQAGETFREIAQSYGVRQNAIREVVKRRDPELREQLNRYRRERQRSLRTPCIRGCGRLIWNWGQRPATGLCVVCLREEAIAAADARDNHGTETRYRRGCRCDVCRQGARDAKRARRERSRVPCSHGCGRMVDSINRGNPDKPPECQSCANRRVGGERRRKASA